MYFITLCVIALTLLIVIWKYMNKPKYDIPGPKGLPFIGITHMLNPLTKFHLTIHDLCKKYGPVMHITTLNSSTVVLSDFDSIYEVLVKQAVACGNRLKTFRIEYCMGTTGLFSSTVPDAKWKDLRRVSHHHLKQFGDGMSELERTIKDIGEDMFIEFADKCGQEYDPRRVIFDAALHTIAFLIIGERPHPDDKIVQQLRQYEEDFMTYNGVFSKFKYMILDFCPWLRHRGYPPFQDLVDYANSEINMWETIKEMNVNNPDTKSLSRVLVDHLGNSECRYNDVDARRAVFNMLLAGMITTANTFYGTLNILAHRPDLQARIFEEIQSIKEKEGQVGLAQRAAMPYTKAFQLEGLRYTAVSPMGVPHLNTEDVVIKGYKIPKNTYLMTFLYRLHHDPNFWDQPGEFKPERFLDEKGELVPADHPNRKHLMPFGAGLRVCVGENLAVARLFIWLVTTVQRFKLTPASDNLRSSIDTKNYIFDVVLRPARYKVIFTQR